MSWLKSLRVDIVHVMGMENTRTGTIEYGLFARRICESEAAPTVTSQLSLSTLIIDCAHLGSLLGAQTIAILSGIMT